MRFLKQIFLTLVILAAGVAVWVAYVPAALPFLERIGITGVLGIKPQDPATARPGGAPGGRPPSGPVSVVAHEVTTVAYSDQLAAIGDGRATHSVALTPEVSGTIASINVQSGSYVQADSVIATLENEIETIALERANLALEDARDTVERFEKLGSSGAVSDLQKRSAELALKTAELAVRQAESELAQRRIVAPISGWIGLIPYETGDQLGPSSVLAQIDDRSSILLEFTVPERFVARIAQGDQVRATPLARPSLDLVGQISALDNRVDPESRMLKVRATLDNADDALRPGMAFRIAMEFQGDAFPAVQPLSIQWSGDGAFVWAVREGKAVRVPVRIVQRNSDSVLVSAELEPGEIVVTEGVQNLRPGSEVVIDAPTAASSDFGGSNG